MHNLKTDWNKQDTVFLKLIKMSEIPKVEVHNKVQVPEVTF